MDPLRLTVELLFGLVFLFAAHAYHMGAALHRL